MNEEVNNRQADLIEEEAVRYPSLVREFPGIALDRDLPIPSIEDELEPQGRAEDAAALNANIAPYVAAGVDGPVIIDADDDKSRLSTTTTAMMAPSRWQTLPHITTE